MAIHPKEHRIVLKYADEPGYTPKIESYLEHGGYDTLKAAFSKKPEDIRDEVKKSQLRGRGGAGFPAGVKWSLVDRKSGKPIYLVCNADESEPGTFKDRQIIHKDPHQLIEGMMISAYANDCAKAFIYIREEMPHGARILDEAILEAKGKGFCGDNICGSEYSCDLVVHRGAAAYICGEETGLIESLEGKRANPRIKPPYFPAVLGLYQCPTIVNNVETLCDVKHIMEMGADEFAKIGRPNNTGTRIWCVSGGVQRPGYYEVGQITLGELVNDICGGPLPGRSIKAIIPGGSSMKILKAEDRYKGKNPDGSEYDWGLEDIPLDYDGIAAAGSMSGSGGMMVLDDTVSIPAALANLMAFYSHESCGQCTPCREGSLWLKKITTRMVHGEARPGDVDLMKSVADQIAGRTICAFGFAVAWPVQSYIAKFEDEFREYEESLSNPDTDRTSIKELACNHG
ncbi:NADH-quinone oxidoreductase subunit NuoF [Puniceicoccaceae bacterium K14]|nr:NADH-quinone oxidoreductase subunit NuoF [Puniceicoccaceae bacterium K14]